MVYRFLSIVTSRGLLTRAVESRVTLWEIYVALRLVPSQRHDVRRVPNLSQYVKIFCPSFIII